MSTDYSKMSDFEINCMIAKILHTNFVQGAFPFINDGSVRLYGCDRCFDFNPCNNPADAWPIIVNNGISLECIVVNRHEKTWRAQFKPAYVKHRVNHENPLRSAMIVFLMMQEGE